MNPLRVAHIVGYYPPHLGGMESVVEELARIQAQEGMDVQVITSNIGARTLPKGFEDEITVNRLYGINIAHTPIMPNLFFRLLRLKNDTIIHLHVAQAFVPEVIWLVARLRRMRYIAHVHIDVGPSGRVGFLLKIYKPLLLSRVLRMADLVVVFNEEQKNSIKERYGITPEKVKIVPNGVRREFFNDKRRSLHAKPHLLFLGRLDVQKNPQQLLESLVGISDKFITTIVGVGELEDDLKSMVKKMHLTNITFYGRANRKEAMKLYRQADIFVMPSLIEGMPLALLEAMAMGLPVVGNDVVGIRSVVQDGKNGILVPLNDTDAMRNALLAITLDGQRFSAMSESGHKMAMKYSWPQVAQQFHELYKEMSINV